jgi:hypothetical protein
MIKAQRSQRKYKDYTLTHRVMEFGFFTIWGRLGDAKGCGGAFGLLAWQVP